MPLAHMLFAAQQQPVASPVSPGTTAGVSLPGSFTRERLPPAPLLERSGSAPLSGWVADGGRREKPQAASAAASPKPAAAAAAASADQNAPEAAPPSTPPLSVTTTAYSGGGGVPTPLSAAELRTV